MEVNMYSLIVYFVMGGQIQTIQVDGFTSKEKCQNAYDVMLPLYADMTNKNKTEIYSYCLLKD